jgi:hypothetical protein
VVPWRLVSVESCVHIAGADAILTAEVLDGPTEAVEARFVAAIDQARIAHLRLTMLSKPARDVPDGLPPGTVLDVFTVEGFRGIGISRLLWPLALLAAMLERWEFRPTHSPSRTEDGQRYAESVGGPIPPLAGGRYVEPAELFDVTSGLWRARQHLNLDAQRRRP